MSDIHPDVQAYIRGAVCTYPNISVSHIYLMITMECDNIPTLPAVAAFVEEFKLFMSQSEALDNPALKLNAPKPNTLEPSDGGGA